MEGSGVAIEEDRGGRRQVKSKRKILYIKPSTEKEKDRKSVV